MTKFVLACAELFFANTTMADNLQDFSWLRDNSLRKDESNDVVKSLCQISNDNPFKDISVGRPWIFFIRSHQRHKSAEKMAVFYVKCCYIVPKSVFRGFTSKRVILLKKLQQYVNCYYWDTNNMSTAADVSYWKTVWPTLTATCQFSIPGTNIHLQYTYTAEELLHDDQRIKG